MKVEGPKTIADYQAIKKTIEELMNNSWIDKKNLKDLQVRLDNVNREIETKFK